MTARGDQSVCVAAILPCPPARSLEAEWRALEARAAPSLFLSWAWIGAQVAAFGTPGWLARVTRGGAVVGLALLGHRKGGWTRDGWKSGWRGASLHLNETGDPGHDGAMIEYNGLLVHESDDEAATAALIGALLPHERPRWRSLHLSGVPEEWAERCRAQGLATRLLRVPQAAPFTDFAALPPGDILDALSSNSRQRIRRSLRWFERRGPLTLDRAANVGEALDWLAALERLHSASWQAKNKPGAFANPSFGLFHRRLIEQSFADGIPDLLRVRAGSQTVGYLYNFLWRGWACAYQSGLVYEEDADCRPGLVAHLLAMRRCRAEGMAGYRFLAGDSRYKASFATGQDTLLWMTARRPGWFTI